LELSQLDRFVASSFSAQQALAVRLEGLLVRYAVEEQPRLAATMAAQKITACLDENFHGDRQPEGVCRTRVVRGVWCYAEHWWRSVILCCLGGEFLYRLSPKKRTRLRK
jgi:hypothetical protein